MLVLSIAGQLLDRAAVRRSRARWPAAVAALGRRLGGAVELFAFAERTPGLAARAARFTRPGYEIQRLVSTREPTAEQLEVGVGRPARDSAGRAAGDTPIPSRRAA